MISINMDVQIDEKIKQKITESLKYKVIFVNDDSTSWISVVDLLIPNFPKHSPRKCKRFHNEDP